MRAQFPTLALRVLSRQEGRVSQSKAWSSLIGTASVFESDMQDLDPAQYGEADRREVDPPVEVEVATWSAAGTLDWWVRERREWWGWVRGADGRQRWIKAADLRPAQGE